MYTSRSIGNLTLVLGSQVRVDLTTYGAPVKGTGGNALKHYNLLNVEMKRAGKAEWPTTEIPPNSFPVRFRLEKAKVPNRYKGCTLIGYFYKGSFDRKFNIVAIAKNLKLHDGRSLIYKVKAPTLDEAYGGDKNGMIEKEFSARGFNDFFNRIPDEAVDWLESQLLDAYTKQVMSDQTIDNESEETTEN